MGLAGPLFWIPQICPNQHSPQVLKFNLVLESQFLEMLQTAEGTRRLQGKVRALWRGKAEQGKQCYSLATGKAHNCSGISIADNSERGMLP